MKVSCQGSCLSLNGGIAMLVLSRRTNEKILLPTLGISIEVRRIAGKRVQLAISAPANIPIQRQEVFERLVREGAKNEYPKSA
jgi:carbon storage regulator CsrA